MLVKVSSDARTGQIGPRRLRTRRKALCRTAVLDEVWVPEWDEVEDEKEVEGIGETPGIFT